MTTFFLVLSLHLLAPVAGTIFIPEATRTTPQEQLWEAVKMVESYGIEDIINHKEQAYGCGQIRQVKLNEYNKATGKSYKLSDCLSEDVSREIFLWHCTKYGHDIETAAKRWNGSGPLTEIYWKKVKRYIR